MTMSSQQTGPVLQHRGATIPAFFYGTAWKETQTEALTRLALQSGFRGIDTANQRRHYYESGVGEAIRRVLAEGLLQRSDLFLQSKFTYASSQDDRIPYDPKADYATQVEQSLQSSLAHLHTAYLDSYILHGPYSRQGLTEADWDVWHTMESLQQSGAVRLIGVSNVGFEQLQLLLEKAKIKPAFVQNRCYASTQWDAKIRHLCRTHGIIYQGFSLLTANTRELEHQEVLKIARHLECSAAQVVFRFALQSGMIPLTGTSSQNHMQEDLAVYGIELDETMMTAIEHIAC